MQYVVSMGSSYPNILAEARWHAGKAPSSCFLFPSGVTALVAGEALLLPIENISHSHVSVTS